MKHALVRFLHRLFVQRTDSTVVQVFRYGIVGTVTFFIDAGILYALTLLPFFLTYYIAAVTVSSVTALVCTYVLSVLWVFKRRYSHALPFEFGVFILIGVIGLLFSYFLVWFFTEIVFLRVFSIEDRQARILAAKVIATVIVFFWNFILRKLILFRVKKP